MHRPATRSELQRILLFSAIYLIASAVYSLRSGNAEFIFYIMVMAVQLSLLIAVHFRVGFSRGLIWCLSLWGLLHMAGGLIPVPARFSNAGSTAVLYNLWLIPQGLKYDQVVHAFGFGVTTWLCWQALSVKWMAHCGEPPTPGAGLMILCAAAGMGFGALNEVVEFFATLSIPETNVGGYVNTGWDLVANLVGAVVAGLLISRSGMKAHEGVTIPD